MNGKDGTRRTRGRPFAKGESGNPLGRPQGARNQTTLALEALLDGEAENITRKVIELALEGDLNALRLCLERVFPVRRERLLSFELPPLKTTSDGAKAMAAIVGAVAAGNVTLGEAGELAKLVERAIEMHEVDERLRAAENKRIPRISRIERTIVHPRHATD